MQDFKKWLILGTKSYKYNFFEKILNFFAIRYLQSEENEI